MRRQSRISRTVQMRYRKVGPWILERNFCSKPLWEVMHWLEFCLPPRWRHHSLPPQSPPHTYKSSHICFPPISTSSKCSRSL
ncbi:hypothetical protein BDZ89DRAFT_448776 [Hymenopellis radicata]|nr:hypothetical protein BDZ89DRAFT_448776 [Hymenopellis radicata]